MIQKVFQNKKRQNRDINERSFSNPRSSTFLPNIQALDLWRFNQEITVFIMSPAAVSRVEGNHEDFSETATVKSVSNDHL